MSSGGTFESRVQHIISTSEILAVARAMQSGASPRVGQTIDYHIEPEASGLVTVSARSPRRGKPYRTVIEQWHLAGALQMLEQWRRTR